MCVCCSFLICWRCIWWLEVVFRFRIKKTDVCLCCRWLMWHGGTPANIQRFYQEEPRFRRPGCCTLSTGLTLLWVWTLFNSSYWRKTTMAVIWHTFSIRDSSPWAPTGRRSWQRGCWWNWWSLFHQKTPKQENWGGVTLALWHGGWREGRPKQLMKGQPHRYASMDVD